MLGLSVGLRGMLYSGPSTVLTTPVAIASGSPARKIPTATDAPASTPGPREPSSAHPISAASSSSERASMYARTSSAPRCGRVACDRNAHSAADVASSVGFLQDTERNPIRTIACTCSNATGTPPRSRKS